MSDDLVPEMHDIGKLVDKSIMDMLKSRIATHLTIPEESITISHDFRCKDSDTNIQKDYDFEQVFGIKEPTTKTWGGITKHHDNRLENMDKDTILLWVSDILAATSSRILSEEDKKRASFGSKDYLQVLWNEEIKSETIKDQKELEGLINFIKRPDDHYFEKYADSLSSIPEDKSSPVNITSLFVHSDLTSKFYHILQEYGTLDTIKKEIKIKNEICAGHIFLTWCKIGISQRFTRAKDLNIFATLNRLNSWLQNSEYYKYLLFSTGDTLWFIYPEKRYLDEVLKEYVNNGFILETGSTEFPLMIKRGGGSPEWYFVCDLYPFIDKLKMHILSELQKLDKLKEEYEDLHTKKREIEQKIKASTNKERVKHINELNNIKDRIVELKNVDAHRRKKKTQERYDNIRSKWKRIDNILPHEFIVQKELSDMIKPPICELCQLVEAKRKDDGEPDPWEKDEIKEYLCETCYDNRGAPGDERADKVHCMNLFRWSTQEEDVNVAWLRVSLDYDILNDAVEDLFSQYVETEGNNKNKSEEEIKKLKSTLLTELRPLAQLDQFTDDYHKFLDELESGLKGIIFDDQSWDKVLSNFYILKIENLSHVKNILKKYNELIDQHFSKLKVVDRSPIKLSISCSNIQFAFFWHWKFLENPQNDVNVNLVGKGEMHLNMRQLDEILNLDMRQFGIHSLHKLSEVSKVSKKLSKVLLYDKGDWRLYKEYDGLRSLLEGGIDFPNILTYAKMMSDQEQVVK